jgi:hypothetical protein
MMKHFLLIAATLALAACGQPAEKAPPATPASEAVNAFDLHIEIGRYGVMLGHVSSLTAERPGAGEADSAAPRELARALRETVWEYNIARSKLCAKGLFSEVACGPAYEPVWISEPASAEPTLQDLQTRADGLGQEVQAFWNAVCDDARDRVEDQQEKMYVCAIE